MTSVQDYLRELRAARKESGNSSAAQTPVNTSALQATPAAVSSPWLKSPGPTQAGRQAAQSSPGQKSRLSATSTPVARRTGAVKRPPAAAGGADGDGDSDSDISRLIDQLSLKSPPVAAPAPAAPAGPRRGSKMDLLRRKFSAASPTKSWADLGSSGGSLSRARGRTSVSILDENIILSISGEELSDEATEPAAPSAAESAAGSRRASDGEVPEQIEQPESSAPTVPSASEVRTETEPTEQTVRTESAETEVATETETESVQTERTESVETEMSEKTVESVKTERDKSEKSDETGREEREEAEESESDTSSSSSDSAAEEEKGRAPGSANSESESKGEPAAAGSSESWLRRLPEDSESPDVESRHVGASPNLRKHEDGLDGSTDRRHEDSPVHGTDRRRSHALSKVDRADSPVLAGHNERKPSGRRASRQDHAAKKRDRSKADRERKEKEDTGAELLEERTRNRRDKTFTKDDHRRRSHGNRSKPVAKPKPSGSSHEQRHGRHREPRRRRRDPEPSWAERTDASESLVVSYQRRVARSGCGGCWHCGGRPAWAAPAPVTVVLPQQTRSAPAAVRLTGATTAATVSMDADEDAAMTALLAQQIVLTRHFLATQRHLHRAYRQALRRTQRHVYTHREDLKSCRRRRDSSTTERGDQD